MKISDIRADTLSNGITLVRVLTDEGPVGISEVGWRSHAAFRTYLDEVIRPKLLGTDPWQVDRHWERLYFGTPPDWIPVPPYFVAVIDIALWDLLGQATGRPLHALLGGAERTTIPLYWSVGAGSGRTVDQMVERVEEGLAQGFRAFKIRMDWGPIHLDTDLVKDSAMAKACRAAVGPATWLGFDANNGYSVGAAIRQGRTFEELGLAHFEEPLPYHDLTGLRQVVDALDIPVSTGEHEATRWRFRDLLQIANPDILQPDILESGGPGEMRRISELANAAGKPLMPHSPAAGILMLASLHVYATLPDGTRPHEYSAEYAAPPESLMEVFEEPIYPEGGAITLPDRPGLGLRLDQKALAKAIEGV